MKLNDALVKIVLLALLGWSVIILGIWLISGNPFSSDAHLVEFAVCLTDTIYKPVERVPIHADHFYLCGKVIGTTGQPGSLLVQYNNRPLYSYSSTFGPGLFFQEIEMTDAFVVGRYEAIFAYARKQLASATFTIE